LPTSTILPRIALKRRAAAPVANGPGALLADPERALALLASEGFTSDGELDTNRTNEN
jgi:hypothetical protein